MIEKYLDRNGDSKTGLVEVDVYNVEEIMRDGGKWGYKEGSAHAFYVKDLRFDEEAYKELVTAAQASGVGGFIHGAGPFVATTNLKRNATNVSFYGGSCVQWLHFSVGDRKALATLREGIRGKKSIQWWVDHTDYAIVSVWSFTLVVCILTGAKQRVLEEYTDPKEEAKVKKFFDMVWADQRKKLAIFASFLLHDDTLLYIASALLQQGLTKDQAGVCIDEVTAYGLELLAEELPRPQAYDEYLSTLIEYAKQGARETAVSRLNSHTTKLGQDVVEISIPIQEVGSKDVLKAKFNAEHKWALFERLAKRKREDALEDEQADRPELRRPPPASGSGSVSSD